ncbi:MAG: hypothetical protein KDK39_00700 [Leptospiraceae bacterium]|nr:hypothetical protein [Leptospiraceae bacterium]
MVRTADLNLGSISTLIAGYTNPTGVLYEASANALYFSEDSTKTLLRYSFLDASVTTIGSGLSGVGGMGYDPALKLLFMASDAGDIIRFNLSDPDPNATKTTIITGLGTNPLSAAVNTSAQRVCWAALSGGGTLPCADYNGGSQSALVTGISAGLVGIEFDANNEFVYWTDYSVGKIQRAKADGSQLTDLVTGYGALGGITLVYQ